MITTGTPSPSRRLRIAMIGLRGIPASYGGVERAVEELAACLVERGHKVTVYARAAYSPVEITEHRGVAVRRLPQINTKHLEAASHTTIALGHALASREFDLIHLHATGPGAMSAIARAARVPVVVTIQGLDWRREKWGRGARAVLRLASSLAARGPDRAIVVSRELGRYYRAELGIATTYIPNGVQFEPEPQDVPDLDLSPRGFVLFLGRLVPEKQLHVLISAYRRVGGELPLVIAGPSSHSPEYVAQLHALAADDARVRLIGPQYGDAKAWLLHNALTFVQPSSIEGLPIALLEALSAGCFPIVSDIPENLEPVTLEDGERLGLSFAVGNAISLTEALEQARKTAATSPDGDRLARHVRETYDWRRITEQTEALYFDAVGERRLDAAARP
jgi:glycosyltransferase involved in cell wall biosynthesis